jgi:hypothetical protein
MRAVAEAETRILRANAQAREISTLAKADAEENRAQTLVAVRAKNGQRSAKGEYPALRVGR